MGQSVQAKKLVKMREVTVQNGLFSSKRIEHKESDKHLSLRPISECIDLSKETVRRILKEDQDRRRFCSICVSYSKKWKRVMHCMQTVEIVEWTRWNGFTMRLLMTDETWARFYFNFQRKELRSGRSVVPNDQEQLILKDEIKQCCSLSCPSIATCQFM